MGIDKTAKTPSQWQSTHMPSATAQANLGVLGRFPVQYTVPRPQRPVSYEEIDQLYDLAAAREKAKDIASGIEAAYYSKTLPAYLTPVTAPAAVVTDMLEGTITGDALQAGLSPLGVLGRGMTAATSAAPYATGIAVMHPEETQAGGIKGLVTKAVQSLRRAPEPMPSRTQRKTNPRLGQFMRRIERVPQREHQQLLNLFTDLPEDTPDQLLFELRNLLDE